MFHRFFFVYKKKLRRFSKFCFAYRFWTFICWFYKWNPHHSLFKIEKVIIIYPKNLLPLPRKTNTPNAKNTGQKYVSLYVYTRVQYFSKVEVIIKTFLQKRNSQLNRKLSINLNSYDLRPKSSQFCLYVAIYKTFFSHFSYVLKFGTLFIITNFYNTIPAIMIYIYICTILYNFRSNSIQPT